MKKIRKMATALAVLVMAGGAAMGVGSVDASAQTESGKVSWYNVTGKKTASGKTGKATTAAHKTIAFNTKVTVKNTSNGKTTTVYILDRGPYVSGRILDMSKESFSKVAKTSAGLFDGKITW